MPGVIEEALMAVGKGQPVFFAGGFGGATFVKILDRTGVRQGRHARRFQAGWSLRRVIALLP